MHLFLHVHWCQRHQTRLQGELRMSLYHPWLLLGPQHGLPRPRHGNWIWWDLQGWTWGLYLWPQETYDSLCPSGSLPLYQGSRFFAFWQFLCWRSSMFYLLHQAPPWNWNPQAGTQLFSNCSLNGRVLILSLVYYSHALLSLVYYWHTLILFSASHTRKVSLKLKNGWIAKSADLICIHSQLRRGYLRVQ